MKLNPLTLSFKDELQAFEMPFRKHFCQTSIIQIRIALIIAMLMYGVFGLLDATIFPEHQRLLAYIRYAIVCPGLAVVLFFTWHRRFYMFMQPAVSFLIVVSASGIIIMAFKAPREYAFSYYAGIALVLMFGYTLSKLRFVYAAFSGWLVLGLYEITALTLGHESLVLFLSNNFFFILVNLLGMLSCYSIEYFMRKEFYSTWQLRQKESRGRNINTELQSTVEARNAELKRALFKQAEMQGKLIESEKIADLGNLVAGIAHEINTPVGVGITATSFLDFKLKQFLENIESDNYNTADLKKFLGVVDESVALTLRNLLRAAELIKMFRLVAVSHSGERKITIGLKYYLEEIIKGLDNAGGDYKYSIEINCPERLEIKNCPDNFALIVNNIVKNSFQHGFKNLNSGSVIISVSIQNRDVYIEFSDDGNGMDTDSVARIFNPFYTTARPEGHTGLGMHIVHSIVSRMFSGSITCFSQPGSGTRVMVSFPCDSADDSEQIAV